MTRTPVAKGEEETKQAINAYVEALPVWSALPATATRYPVV